MEELFKDCPTFQSLSPEHQHFVLAYLREYNITKAYQEVYPDANYDSARYSGSRLFANVNTKKAFDEVREILHANMVADAQEIREFWTFIIRSAMTDIAHWNKDGLVFTEDSEDIPREVARLIRELKVTTRVSQKGDWTESEVNVKTLDPIKASKLLAQSRGMLVDKKETTIAGEIRFRIADAEEEDDDG